MSEKTSLPYDHAEKVCRAERYQALHVAHSNYSFTSTQENSKKFKLMFPYCPIIHSYVQADPEVKYNLHSALSHTAKNNLEIMSRDALLPSSSIRAPIDFLKNSMINMSNIGQKMSIRS